MALVSLRARARLVTLSFAVAASVAVLPASEASANLLPPAVRTLPITSPLVGGGSVGAATLTVTYMDSDATAVATAPTIKLGKNNVYRIRVCVKAHSLGASFGTECAAKTVDTMGLLSAITVAAPSVTTKMARPASGGRAYFSYVTTIEYTDAANTPKEGGTSWPVGGLGSAYVGVPAQGAKTSPVPATEGAALRSGKTGGINNGLPDSMCTARYYAEPEPTGPGVSTSALGFDAPAYYEVGEPTGEHAGKPPVGVMMVIHGGGWSLVGEGAVASMRDDADRWRARGWRTLNVTYRPCAASFGDVRWFYDRAVEEWGADMPYCALGASAGGNIAVMLAHGRDLDCVIDQGGPTDALALKTQSTPVGGTDGPRWIYNGMAAAAGPENLIWWSPARFPAPGRGISARALFAVEAKDPYIPYAQGTLLRDKMVAADPEAYVDLMRLDPGDTFWVHSKVSASALQAYYEREEELVAPLVG